MKKLVLTTFLLFALYQPALGATYDITGNWLVYEITSITYDSGNLASFDQSLLALSIALAKGKQTEYTQTGDTFISDDGDTGTIVDAVYTFAASTPTESNFFGTDITKDVSDELITLSDEDEGVYTTTIVCSFTVSEETSPGSGVFEDVVYSGTYICEFKVKRYYSTAEYDAAGGGPSTVKTVVIPLF